MERTWEWSPTWSEIMGVGACEVSAADRGGVCRIGARHRLPNKPAAGGPPQPQPLKPRDAFTKALGAIHPTLNTQGIVCCVCSSVDLGKRPNIDLAKPPPPSLEGF